MESIQEKLSVAWTGVGGRGRKQEGMSKKAGEVGWERLMGDLL